MVKFTILKKCFGQFCRSEIEVIVKSKVNTCLSFSGEKFKIEKSCPSVKSILQMLSDNVKPSKLPLETNSYRIS